MCPYNMYTIIIQSFIDIVLSSRYREIQVIEEYNNFSQLLIDLKEQIKCSIARNSTLVADRAIAWTTVSLLKK